MKTCPICKQKLRHESWSGELGLEEYIEECKNNKCKGYKEHYYYGKTDLVIGDFCESIYYSDLDDSQLKTYNTFLNYINYYKNRRYRRKRKVR